MRSGRKFETDPVAGANEPAREDDSHDPGLAHELAVFVVVEDGRHEAGLEAIELDARVTQACDFHDGCLTEVKAGVVKVLSLIHISEPTRPY